MAEITPAGRRLREYAEDSGAKMLVLDPLAAAFGSNENDRGLVRAFLANWDRWGRDNKLRHTGDLPSTEGGPGRHTLARRTGRLDQGSCGRWTTKLRTRVRIAIPALTLEKSNYGRRGARIWLQICNKGVWAEASTERDTDEFVPIPGV